MTPAGANVNEGALMHNVNVQAVEQTAARATADPSAVRQAVAFDGEWQTTPGDPQFTTEIPLPSGETRFATDRRTQLR